MLITLPDSNDGWLNFFTEKFNVTSISVGYRLAPEDPFPAGPNDCLDAAEWLVKNSKEKFGAELQIIGGEVNLLSYYSISEHSNPPAVSRCSPLDPFNPASPQNHPRFSLLRRNLLLWLL